MSLSVPTRRRLLSPAISILQSQPQSQPSHFCQHVQNRSISNPFTSILKRQRQKSKENPNQLTPAMIEKAREEKAAAGQGPHKAPQTGDLAPGSIFEEPTSGETSPAETTPARGRDPYIMAAVLDPTPHARRRWQRKMLIRDIRGRHRLNRTEKILRTERSHLSKSPFFRTSIKKLYPLARQIAGKPLEEAMLQMRFSKKKAAKDVLEHLSVARDEAVVGKGMGLGRVEAKKTESDRSQQEQQEQEHPQAKSAEGQDAAPSASQSEISQYTTHQPLLVEDKSGKKRLVTDPTAMYISEAWVGRGAYETGSDHRARGRINQLRLPHTSISVVLKEEKTRIRMMAEREAERQRKKVWVPLPDRKVTAQRQYCLW